MSLIALFVVFMIQGMIKFAKIRAGCRYSVFDLAEQCHGKVREGNPHDGISYVDRSPHLSFQLTFVEEYQAEDFESKVARIPENYRKRKPTSSEVAPDIEVELRSIQRIVTDAQLVRVKVDQYEKIEGDTDGSPEFDIFSDSLTSAVELSDETKLRLIEREDSTALFRLKPEKCHLISQRRYKDDSKNPNNIVFMSRNLHQQFDAINSSEGIPMFYLVYVSHHSASIQGVVNNRPCPVYETTVNVVFKDEEAMNVLSVSLKRHTILSNNQVQIVLYFPNPEEFKIFANARAEETIARWKSYDGMM